MLSDSSKAEDNSNVQIKPKVARLDHTLGSKWNRLERN